MFPLRRRNYITMDVPGRNALVNVENIGSTGAFMRAYVVSGIKPRALSPAFSVIPPPKVYLR